MNLDAAHAEHSHEALPLGVDVNGFDEHRTELFEFGDFVVSILMRQAETVIVDGSRGNVPELRHDLRGDDEGFAVTNEPSDRPHRCGVHRVRRLNTS
jgi:hypothetical protein